MIDPADSVTQPLPQPTLLRFASDTGVYCISLDVDLLGDWTVVQSWAQKGARKGGGKVAQVGTFREGMELLNEVAKRCLRRGFLLAT